MQLKRFDKYVRHYLHTFRPSAPDAEDVWANIAHELDRQDRLRRRRQPLIPLALMLAFGLTGGLLLKDSSRHSHNFSLESTSSLNQADNALSSNANSGNTPQVFSFHKSPSLFVESATAQPSTANKLNKPEYSPRNSSKLLALTGGDRKPADVSSVAASSTALHDQARAVSSFGGGLAMAKIVVPSQLATYAKRSIQGRGIFTQARREPQETASSGWQSILFRFWDNPAYTAVEGPLSFSANNEVQLSSYLGALYHNCFGMEMQLPHSQKGVGFYYDHSATSYTAHNKAALTFSLPLLQLNAGTLRFGAAVSYLSRSIMTKQPTLGRGIDPVFGFAYPFTHAPIIESHALGMDASLFFQGERLTAGITVDNLNRPRFGDSPDARIENMQWHAFFAYSLQAGRNLRLTPVFSLHTSTISEANVLMLAEMGQRYMLGAGLGIIGPQAERLAPSLYAGITCKKVRFFASYGVDAGLSSDALATKQLIRAGLNWQLKQR